MITDAIIIIVVGLLSGILSLVPAYGGADPLGVSGMETIGSQLGGALALSNKFFPVTVLGACLAITFAIKAFGSVWAVLVWVYDRIPFKAS